MLNNEWYFCRSSHPETLQVLPLVWNLERLVKAQLSQKSFLEIVTLESSRRKHKSRCATRQCKQVLYQFSQVASLGQMFSLGFLCDD